MAYLVLGDRRDLCCSLVYEDLVARGQEAEIIDNPLAGSVRFQWQLNSMESISRLIWDDGRRLDDSDIAGVLVRSTGWMRQGRLQEDDWTYLQTETQAALLAWLHALPCPVVNRYSPDLWYRPSVPFLYWSPLLQQCGLPPKEAFLTNSAHELQRIRDELCDGAVYMPLTSAGYYLVNSDEDWDGMAALQRRMPICLTRPHGTPHLACVVGDAVVWENPAPDRASMEPSLRRFCAAAGLSFCEVALAPTALGMRVVAVDHHPKLERFGDSAQQGIARNLTSLLCAEVTERSRRTAV